MRMYLLGGAKRAFHGAAGLFGNRPSPRQIYLSTPRGPITRFC